VLPEKTSDRSRAPAVTSSTSGRTTAYRPSRSTPTRRSENTAMAVLFSQTRMFS
jgi:hypothetical protein